jgi:hypothetical protein
VQEESAARTEQVERLAPHTPADTVKHDAGLSAAQRVRHGIGPPPVEVVDGDIGAQRRGLLNLGRAAGRTDHDDALAMQGLYEQGADAAGSRGNQRDVPGPGVGTVENPESRQRW